jgi:hypothetical protein
MAYWRMCRVIGALAFSPVSLPSDISSGACADAAVATRLCGMLAMRRVWLPTWRGLLVLSFLLVLAGFGFVKGIHPFLAVDAPVSARVMVVEGWIAMPALHAAAGRFRSEEYDMICTVGGSAPGLAFDSLKNDAVIVADQFLEMGLPPAQVFAVPSGEPQRDRTYTSASVLRDWFLKRGGLPKALNVVTVGPHSRRSRLLFEKAFGGTVAVGVISMPAATYDASHWWRYSEGVKEVLSEGAAYLYARFLFDPD